MLTIGIVQEGKALHATILLLPALNVPGMLASENSISALFFSDLKTQVMYRTGAKASSLASVRISGGKVGESQNFRFSRPAPMLLACERSKDRQTSKAACKEVILFLFLYCLHQTDSCARVFKH